MPQSVYNKRFDFNLEKWVVTLINTKKGTGGVIGGHAKIVVEGVIREENSMNTKLFVGEYHIMEAGEGLGESCVPQALRNSQGNFGVFFTETDKYALADEKYAEVSSRSGYALPDDVKKMILNIKNERDKIESGEKDAKFQYAGNKCFYSYNGGHNCTSWAEEKLKIVGLEKELLFDYIKAAPSSHTTSSSQNSCVIS